MALRVIVHDRQMLTLLGVRAILEPEPDIEIVRETRTARQLPALVRDLAPDLVVIGLPADEADVVDLVRRLVAADAGAGPGVIVMATPTHEVSLLEALRAGVRGVVSKENSPSELVRAIRAVAAGEAVLTSTMTRHLLDWAARVPMATVAHESVLELLSERERKVLELVSSGMSDSDVAVELHVSTATVRSHMHHITSKLGLSGRTQVVAFAYREGLMAEAG